jgi:hypothetical protein
MINFAGAAEQEQIGILRVVVGVLSKNFIQFHLLDRFSILIVDQHSVGHYDIVDQYVKAFTATDLLTDDLVGELERFGATLALSEPEADQEQEHDCGCKYSLHSHGTLLSLRATASVERGMARQSRLYHRNPSASNTGEITPGFV